MELAYLIIDQCWYSFSFMVDNTISGVCSLVYFAGLSLLILGVNADLHPLLPRDWNLLER